MRTKQKIPANPVLLTHSGEEFRGVIGMFSEITLWDLYYMAALQPILRAGLAGDWDMDESDGAIFDAARMASKMLEVREQELLRRRNESR